ncbi:MAG: cytochrome c3 family protein [Gammaproteobacteria bacterium]|nr:cytochrome c3 family protein [Gammaproteobacteria bacterium]
MKIYRILIAVLALMLAHSVAAAEKDKFKGQFWSKGTHFQITGDVVRIAEDGIHDPSNISGMYGLQQPVEAMGEFPRDSAGLLDWVQTLKQGHIAPRSDINGTGPDLKPLDLDIIFPNTGSMPKVLFPHRQHTEWLACKNCHPAIFVKKKGGNKFKMTDVLTGKYCGVCHGKIAFAPTKNCMRCHSVPKNKN